MAVADFADVLEIAGNRGYGAQGGTDHRFGDKGDDILATQLRNLGFQFPGQPCAIVLGRLMRGALAILVDGRHMVRLD